MGRRELNPHGPQSQCGALPIELRPTQKGDKESSVTRHLADVVTFSIRPELEGMTRLELANQLIENQSAFHFAFIPVIVVRVERFELITKLVLSQPPLPIGLHAQIDLKLVLARGFEPLRRKV